MAKQTLLSPTFSGVIFSNTISGACPYPQPIDKKAESHFSYSNNIHFPCATCCRLVLGIFNIKQNLMQCGSTKLYSQANWAVTIPHACLDIFVVVRPK